MAMVIIIATNRMLIVKTGFSYRINVRCLCDINPFSAFKINEREGKKGLNCFDNAIPLISSN